MGGGGEGVVRGLWVDAISCQSRDGLGSPLYLAGIVVNRARFDASTMSPRAGCHKPNDEEAQGLKLSTIIS